MLTTDTKQDAMESYRRGASLVSEERYREAIPFLSRAADLFRRHDEQGHPAEQILKNGVTALASAHAGLGICAERTGDISRAISHFETAFINERFERSAAFRPFAAGLKEQLISCYERQVASAPARHPESLAGAEAVVDTTYRFPFSLDPGLIPYARLYELAPKRYPHLRSFYESSREYDAVTRRAGSRTDDQSMRKISIGVWTVIAAIWVAYGIVVIRTLAHAP